MIRRPAANTSWISATLLVSMALSTSLPARPASEIEQCRQRRQAVLQAMNPGDVLVLHAGVQLPGVLPGLVGDADFLYLVGLAEEGMTLLLSRQADGASREQLFVKARSAGRERWDGERIGPGAAAARLTGIPQVLEEALLLPQLQERIAQAPRVFHNFRRHHGESKPQGEVATALLEFHGDGGAKRARPRLLTAPLRQVKDGDEIRRMRRAIAITCDALRRAIVRIRPGMHEYQVQTVIEATMRWHGAEGLAFPSIIGSGDNGTVLHYRANRARIDDGDLIVMDVGARYLGYCADVTRTVPASGRFSPRQRELYEIVLEAQRAGFEACRPGSSMGEVHRAARSVIEAAGHGEHFTHGTSHWLGLDVHDAGVRDAELAPGMVLTVEPGLYLPEEGIGIRVEDDVLITEAGHVILSNQLPREAAEIEALMNSRQRH